MPEPLWRTLLFLIGAGVGYLICSGPAGLPTAAAVLIAIVAGLVLAFIDKILVWLGEALEALVIWS